ncbi:MAG TPA: TonB family protein [Candidatus Acidoferrum sp.]|nr:TonB family protein [Candidatus Acidoferrum sp.]
MSEQWKTWAGQTVDAKFPLRQFVAGTSHSAVFLTELSATLPQKAAIKLIAGFPAADSQLALWKRAAHLQHPNLLPIFDCGRCRLGDQDFLYVVMEYAEENLGEILPLRALTPEEARDILDPSLDVLVYLHGKGLAHGHLRPSNLLAAQDCLKLSSDSVFPIGERREYQRERDVYDAPDSQSSPVSPKGDVWSLGATLLEALTQHPPMIPAGSSSDPAIPDGIPELFREIVRHSLRREAGQRWSVAEIAARLNPTPLAAAATAGASSQAGANVSPLSIPLSAEPAVPLAKLPAAAEKPPRHEVPVSKRGNASIFDYTVPGLLAAAVLVGLIFAVPKLLNFHSQPISSANSLTAEKSVPAKLSETSEPQASPALAARPPEKITTEETQDNLTPRPAEASTPTPAPAVLRDDPSSMPHAKKAEEAVGRGEVLDQVLPHVPPKAQATIQGTIRVVVKVLVDPSGSVTNTELDTPGPSKYFADLAEKAARHWQFAGAEADGHGVPSEWLIRFEFAQSGVHAAAQQSAP